MQETEEIQVQSLGQKDPLESFWNLFEKIPWNGYGTPFQYSCLENPTDRGAWQAMVHSITESHD